MVGSFSQADTNQRGWFIRDSLKLIHSSLFSNESDRRSSLYISMKTAQRN